MFLHIVFLAQFAFHVFAISITNCIFLLSQLQKIFFIVYTSEMYLGTAVMMEQASDWPVETVMSAYEWTATVASNVEASKIKEQKWERLGNRLVF